MCLRLSCVSAVLLCRGFASHVRHIVIADCRTSKGIVELTYPDAGYPERLSPSGKFVANFTKLTCLEIAGYQIKYNTVLWLLELQIRGGRKVQTQVHTVNSNS
jgi:hypothetical protein